MCKKALVVGPNIGVSMGKGGGVRVAAKMGEILADNNYEVCLCAFKGYALNFLDSVHGTSLLRHRNLIQTRYLINSQWGSIGAEGFSGAFPIHVGVLPFSLYLRYVLRAFSPHLLIFHDDIPLLRRRELRDRFVLLYVHFSYATRLRLGVGDIVESVAPSRRCIEELLDPLIKHLIFLHNNPANLILANSSVTAEFLKKTWNKCDVQILHPPVDTDYHKSSRKKENLVVSIGVVQPNKRFEDVIRAMGTTSPEHKLIIIGHSHQSWYCRELRKLIHKMGLNNRVRIVLDASREQLRDFVSRAKIIVHASRFEPFGISVVEGMASGCVPIVYNSPTSGPWSDVANRGEYGLGFNTIEELSQEIERVLNSDRVFSQYSLKAKKRSQQFDTSIFRQNFMRIMSGHGL